MPKPSTLRSHITLNEKKSLERYVILDYVSRNLQLTNILTKAFLSIKFEKKRVT